MSEGPPEQEDMEEEEEMEGQEWNGHRLLTMAGLFDVWRPADVSISVFLCKKGDREKIRKAGVICMIH